MKSSSWTRPTACWTWAFIHDVRKVIALLPRKRQTLLFSATMPAEVEKLALSILTDPASVKVDPVSSTVDRIEQRLYLVDKANKKLLLAKLLKEPEVESALVFHPYQARG